jgi:glycosyltransferase involved in cell wall biosynthesis
MVEQGARAPTFSVIIPCYNNAQFIRETVGSALSQTRQPLQVIVVDDASSDSSVSVLREFGEKITLLPQGENRGGSAARNIGASVAEGDYLVFLDGDDVLAPWALELYGRIAETKRPKVILASLFFFGGASVPESDIYLRGDAPIRDFDVYSTDIEIVDYGMLRNKDRPFRRGGTSMVIERDSFNRVKGWSEDIFPAEDTELLLKLLYEAPAVQILSPPSAYYRVHGENITRQVRRYCAALTLVIKRARERRYTPPEQKRSDAYEFLAGQVLYWSRSGLRTKDYGLAFKILAEGLPMVFVAMTRKVASLAKGRLPAERLGPLKDVH